MQKITAQKIISKYDNIFLDAFGVLLNSSGLIEFAKDFINELNTINKNYFVLSNGSKFTPEKSAESYRKRGLNIANERVITSGGLLKDWFEKNPKYKTSKILGPKSSEELVTWAGGTITSGSNFDTLIICNQDGFSFPDKIDEVISEIHQKILNRKNIKLLLPNPDLLFPTKDGFGITSGTIAKMIENALNLLFAKDAPKFEMLGKPYSPIFDKALDLSTGSSCMIGDQLETDMYGANSAQIDSILVETGICNRHMADNIEKYKLPKYFLKNLSLK